MAARSAAIAVIAEIGKAKVLPLIHTDDTDRIGASGNRDIWSSKRQKTLRPMNTDCTDRDRSSEKQESILQVNGDERGSENGKKPAL